MKYLFTFFIFLSFLFSNGQEIYIKKCSSCHGKNGEKVAFSKTSPLIKLSALNIQDRVKAYRSGNFGGSGKMIMSVEARKISNADLKEIIKFLKGENSLNDKKEDEEILKTPTKQGIYLE